MSAPPRRRPSRMLGAATLLAGSLLFVGAIAMPFYGVYLLLQSAAQAGAGLASVSIGPPWFALATIGGAMALGIALIWRGTSMLRTP